MFSDSGQIINPLNVDSDSSDTESVYKIESEEEYDPAFEFESYDRGSFGEVWSMNQDLDFLSQTSTLCLPPPSNRCGSRPMKKDIVNRIRNTYNVPESVELRIPSKNEGHDCNKPDEVVVYEAFFAIGLRDSIPSLVAKIANLLGISPGQFSPHAWRVLVAIQVFGELFSVSLGEEEVLFAYFFKCYDLTNGRVLIQRRTSCPSPLVYDLERNKRYRTSYDRQWTRKYLFMRVGM